MMRPALWESDIQAALKRNRWAFLADIADSSYTESDRDCRRENGVKNVRHDASPLLSCHDTLLFCKYLEFNTNDDIWSFFSIQSTALCA